MAWKRRYVAGMEVIIKPLTGRAGWGTEVALEILPEPLVKTDSGGSSFLCAITLPLCHFGDLFGKLQDSRLRNSAEWGHGHLHIFPRKPWHLPDSCFAAQI